MLAAGLGTRLRPLTDELPKPAVPVLNRPLAAFALEHLARSGIDTIALNTHHLHTRLREVLEPAVPVGVRSVFVHEPEILGTGGGIKNVWRALGEPDPFVVMNGDVLFEPNLEAAFKLHQELGAIATMVLRSAPDADRYGAVETDPHGQVRRLLGVPQEAAGLRKTMFTGVHLLSARAIESLPERGCVVRQGYRAWLDAGQVIAGFVDESLWLELGTPADYAAAQFAALQGAGWPVTGINRDASLIDGRASIDPRACLRGCVIGAGCVVEGAVTLDGVIAWPGARVDYDATNLIVTHAGQRVTPKPTT